MWYLKQYNRTKHRNMHILSSIKSLCCFLNSITRETIYLFSHANLYQCSTLRLSIQLTLFLRFAQLWSGSCQDAQCFCVIISFLSTTYTNAYCCWKTLLSTDEKNICNFLKTNIKSFLPKVRYHIMLYDGKKWPMHSYNRMLFCWK